MGIIALIAFWASAIKLWVADGPKIPIIFILIWLIGLFCFQRVWVRSGYGFVVFEAILTVILIIIERHKSHVGTSIL